MKFYPNFQNAIFNISADFKATSQPVHTEKWQGFDIQKKPDAQMYEVLNMSFTTTLDSEDLEHYRGMIKPNLPWVDEHFDERISGIPYNPGKTWLSWPWSNKADHSRQFGGKFSHSYMERYWPKFAGNPDDGILNPNPHTGIRFEYGDLQDVVNLLADQPSTRQAYLPIFFPEDTGALHGNRVPCTLGYFWIQRRGYLHVYYPIRSCDFYRHFRDDLYLTTRLTLWILDQLRQKRGGEFWGKVRPGFFSMWVGSLHLFINDYQKLFGERK